MTVSMGTVLIALLVLFAIGLGILVRRYFLLRIPAPSLADRRRSFVYLVRFSNGLLFRGIGDRERRSRVKELRANLAEAAAADGMAEAIDRLGSPRRLAASVVEGRMRPTWVNGIVAFGLAIEVAVLLHGIVLDAWVSAAEAGGADTAVGTVSLLPGAHLSYERDGAFWITSPWLIILPLVAFLVWSRPWRLLMRDRGRETVTT